MHSFHAYSKILYKAVHGIQFSRSWGQKSFVQFLIAVYDIITDGGDMDPMHERELAEFGKKWGGLGVLVLIMWLWAPVHALVILGWWWIFFEKERRW